VNGLSLNMTDVTQPMAQRIVVGVHGSLTSLAALRTAVSHARERAAVLVPVLAWSPVGGELAYRRAPCPELLELWRRDAQGRLTSAFDEALGGCPRDIEVRAHVMRGAPGGTLVEIASTDRDLLVLGRGRRRLAGRRGSGPTARYCLTHAHCPVLLVPPPELLGVAAALGQRRWTNLRLDQPPT
jgi:nucleotide-binding universal stress UspA family protein